MARPTVRVATSASPPERRIGTILESLIDERRRLLADGSDASLCEANRIAIVYWQRQLERARARGAAPHDDLGH